MGVCLLLFRTCSTGRFDQVILGFVASKNGVPRVFDRAADVLEHGPDVVDDPARDRAARHRTEWRNNASADRRTRRRGGRGRARRYSALDGVLGDSAVLLRRLIEVGQGGVYADL